jgi:palmitoyltransferase ZDHHC9/14/18
MPHLAHDRIGFSHRFACLCRGDTSISVVVGPDWKALLCTVALVVGSTIVYVVQSSQSAGRSALVSLLAVNTLGFLLRCALTEPGIIPVQPLPASVPPMIVREASSDLGGGLNVVERRWCTACNLYRPLRTVHCRFCNVCILRRDHHCPWTGTCVGERNYRYYVGFIFSALVSAVVIVAGSLLDLHASCRKWKSMNPADGWEEVFRGGIRHFGVLGVTVFLMGIIACAMLLNLVVFHWYLLRHNATTSEEHKGGAYAQHPFSAGSHWKNVKSVLFGHPMPSLLGRRGDAKLLDVLAVKPIDMEVDRIEVVSQPPTLPTPKTPTGPEVAEMAPIDMFAEADMKSLT